MTVLAPSVRRGRRQRTRREVRRLFPWLVCGIVLLALILRAPFLTARSLWFDEAFSWRLIAHLPSPEFFARAAADVHPVLYYLVLWVWMVPLRLRDVGPDVTLFWMRFLSVVLGCATVAAMVLAGRVLFRSRWVGGAAGLLTAVNAFQIQYAWEARMYTLGTLLLPLAMVELYRAVERRTPRRAWRSGIGFGVSLGALLHVHYYALFSWFALGAAKLLVFVRRMFTGGVSRVVRSPNFAAAEVGFWLSALLFLPWIPTFLQQSARVQAAYWIPRMDAWSIPKTFARLFWGGAADIPEAWAVLATVAAIVITLVPLLRGRSFGDGIAAASFVFPIALSAVVSLRTSVFLDRYFLFASLGLILLVARTLSFLPGGLPVFRKTVRSPVVLLGVLTLLGLGSVVRFWDQLDFGNKPGARGAAAFLRAHTQSGEPIVVSSPFVYFPISFHAGCRMPDARCQNGLTVRLYSETGEVVHFAGGPILDTGDLVGPQVFRPPTSDLRLLKIWVVDTTGFGGSTLGVPPPYRLEHEARFPEVFAYQGDMVIREYAAP